MASFSYLLLFGCVGLGLAFGAFVQGERTNTSTYPWANKGLNCDYKLRVIFTSEKWTTEMDRNKIPRDIEQDLFFVGIMEDIVTSAKESGISCSFEESIHVLTCCDAGNLGEYRPVTRKEQTASEKFWGHDITTVNFVFMFINLFFFMFLMSWGLILSIKFPGTLVPLGLGETSEAS